MRDFSRYSDKHRKTRVVTKTYVEALVAWRTRTQRIARTHPEGNSCSSGVAPLCAFEEPACNGLLPTSNLERLFNLERRSSCSSVTPAVRALPTPSVAWVRDDDSVSPTPLRALHSASPHVWPILEDLVGSADPTVPFPGEAHGTIPSIAPLEGDDSPPPSQA